MAARFAVVREFRKDTISEKTKKLRNIVYKKLKGIILNFTCFIWIRIGFVDGGTPPCVKFKLCKQTIFCKNKHKEFLKNISG